MAKLTNGTSWTATQSQTSQNATYTFSTANKYVDKDIQLQVSIPGIVLKKPTASGSYTTFTVQIEGDSTVYNWKVDSSGDVWIE